MRAVVYTGPEVYSVTEAPRPAFGSRDVRIAVERVGVCGTDLHVHHATIPVGSPVIPGHEVVGVVESAGEGVRSLGVGERVVVNPNVPCGVCDVCRRKPSMQCRNLRGFGVGEDGGLAEYLVVPETHAFAVGQLQPEIAAFAEPLACVVNAVDRVDPEPGRPVLIFGAGPSAALMAATLRARGVGPITVAAPEGRKLQAMSDFGAQHLVAMERSEPHAAERQLREVSGGEGFDVVVDVTGATTVAEITVDHVAAGGTVLLYGVARPGAGITIRPYDLFHRDLTILGSFAQTSSMMPAISLLASGAVDPRPLITHEYALEDWSSVIAAVENDRTVHKAVVVLHP